jgi:hypothetical protein
MEPDIRCSERSPQPFESRDAFLTADDVNELCRRWIEAERERTRALPTELIAQIQNEVVPEVVSTLPQLTGPIGPPGLLPIVKLWQPDTVHYRGEVVAFDGGTWQATKDTGTAPPHADWTMLAHAGRDGITPRVRGTWSDTESYRALDIVALNGGSFVARRNDPGPCPGEGWQVMAQGKRGVAGEKGPQGERGPKGEPGEAGTSIRSWKLDRTRYVATPIMSDGKHGPPLELRGLFEQFLAEVA